MYAKDKIVRASNGQSWTVLVESLSRLHQLDIQLWASTKGVLDAHHWTGTEFAAMPNATALAAQLQRTITGVIFCFLHSREAT